MGRVGGLAGGGWQGSRPSVPCLPTLDDACEGVCVCVFVRGKWGFSVPLWYKGFRCVVSGLFSSSFFVCFLSFFSSSSLMLFSFSSSFVVYFLSFFLR